MGRKKKDEVEEVVTRCHRIINDEASNLNMKICAAEALLLHYKQSKKKGKMSQIFKVGEDNDTTGCI